MKKISLMLITALIAGLCNFVPIASAASQDVVINEIAWMGSTDNSNDEWIELYNNTSSSIDLSGWYITDDETTTYTIESGTISANGFFLIEDSEESVNTITADAVIGLSLANTGDTLILYDSAGNEIDTVNSSGTMWAGGDNDSKATMERIDSNVSGDDDSNWSSNQSSSGDTGSSGGEIIGTPRTINSVSEFSGTHISASTSSNPQPGSNWIVDININDVDSLFSYGIDLNYDTNQLSLIGVEQKHFLDEGGVVNTSFHYGIDSLNSQLVIGEARTQNTKSTVSGSGTLLTLTFHVNGADGDTGSLDFLGGSFLGGLSGDITGIFEDLEYTIGSGSGGDDTVGNLQIQEDTERYALTLTWNAPVSGADSYNIYRTDTAGNFALIGNTAELTFTDNDSLDFGGNIIPLVEYNYSVTALSGGSESEGITIVGQETRGLKGDNNRSDRVDGRDLEALALHFSETVNDSSFDPLIDTSYDGFIDGDDLIHIGVNWAQHYVQ